MASLFAEQLPALSNNQQELISILDFGCGTGLTSLACCNTISKDGRSTIRQVALVDHFQYFVADAAGTIRFNSSAVQDVVGCPLNLLNTTTTEVERQLTTELGQWKRRLVVAQQLLTDIPFEQHHLQLRLWRNWVDTNGYLVVDIPHPQGRISGFWIGRRGKSVDLGPTDETFFALDRPSMWVEAS